jgi:hypothetical protein
LSSSGGKYKTQFQNELQFLISENFSISKLLKLPPKPPKEISRTAGYKVAKNGKLGLYAFTKSLKLVILAEVSS